MLDLLTENDVSKRLNVSVASLRRWRLQGRGPAFLKVGCLVRYRPEDLESWIAHLPAGGYAGERRIPLTQAPRWIGRAASRVGILLGIPRKI